MEQLLLIAAVIIIVVSTLAGSLVRLVAAKFRDRKTKRLRKTLAMDVPKELQPVRRFSRKQEKTPVGGRDESPGTRVAEFDSSNGYATSEPPAPPPRVSAKKADSALQRISTLSPLKRAIIWSEILGPPVSERRES